jgi:hypothetical protein
MVRPPLRRSMPSGMICVDRGRKRSLSWKGGSAERMVRSLVGRVRDPSQNAVRRGAQIPSSPQTGIKGTRRPYQLAAPHPWGSTRVDQAERCPHKQ